jgi:hypothetical protein
MVREEVSPVSWLMMAIAFFMSPGSRMRRDLSSASLQTPPHDRPMLTPATDPGYQPFKE